MASPARRCAGACERVALLAVLMTMDSARAMNLTIGVCNWFEISPFLPLANLVFDEIQRSTKPLVPMRHLNDTVSIQYMTRETACNPELGQQVGEEFYGAKVNVILGCTCSGVSAVMARIGTVMKIPQITWMSGAFFLTKQRSEYKYFMRTLTPLVGLPAGICNTLKFFHWTQAKVLYEDNPYDRSFAADVFVQSEKTCRPFGIVLTAVMLDLTTMGENPAPINGSCGTSKPPLTLSLDGIRCEDLAKWEETIGTASRRVLVHLFFISSDPRGLAALPIALRLGLFRHPWLLSVGKPQLKQIGIEGVWTTQWTGMEGSLAITEEPADRETAASSRFKEFWAANATIDRYKDTLDPQWKDSMQAQPDFPDVYDKASLDSLMPYTDDLMNALMTIYLAIDKLLGEGHRAEHISGTNLHNAMMGLEFEGWKGTMKYNEDGDPDSSVVENRFSMRNLNHGGWKWAFTVYGNGTVVPQVYDDNTSHTIVWPGGGHEVPRDTPAACPQGEYYDGLECRSCTVGYGLVDSECAKCNVGKAGIGTCDSCMKGKFANESGLSACRQCPEGFECDSYELADPKPCAKGTFSNSTETRACLLCPVGFYADEEGSTACLTCIPKSTKHPDAWTSLGPLPGVAGLSPAAGRTSASDCACASGSYLRDSDCTPCLEGMLCPSGSEAAAMFPTQDEVERGSRILPLVREGYMTLKTDPLIVFACRNRADCPGGREGQCATHRDTSAVACGSCEVDAYEDSGTCMPCGKARTAGAAMLAALGVGSGVALLAMTFPYEPSGTITGLTFRRMMHADVATNALVAFVNLLQTTWIFVKQDGIRWPTSSKSTFRGPGSLFDLSIFRLECAFLGDRREVAVWRSALVNCLPLGAFTVLGLAYLIGRRFKDRGVGSMYFPDPCLACSTSLSILTAFFLVIVSSAINMGFSRFPHPNGQYSLIYFPFILTTNPEAKAIQAVSIIGILVWCVMGLSLVTYLLMKLPSKVMDVEFRRMTLSLTSRFHHECPWFILVQLAMSLMIALGLSLWETGLSQIAWMVGVFVVYLVALTSIRPYFCPLNYYCDVTCTVGKLLILIAVLPYQTTSQQFGAHITIIAVAVYCAAAAHCGYGLWLLLRNFTQGTTYDIPHVWFDLGGRAAAVAGFPKGASLLDLTRAADEGRISENTISDILYGRHSDVGEEARSDISEAATGVALETITVVEDVSGEVELTN
mmetsp:Transcript_95304/g.308716  ORF Transcript_95304/g.308716 Transcript_95304/m.308716 type:complete len:1209 (+) Transcript_95304:74-3700(+)